MVERVIRVNPKTEKDHKHRWHHYGLKGSISMIRQNLRRIALSPTSTEDTKQLAWDMMQALEKLKDHLNQMVSTDGITIPSMSAADKEWEELKKAPKPKPKS